MKKILAIFIALVMCMGLLTTAFAADFKFKDVKESDWYYNDVKSAVEQGLINGKSADTYAPDDNLTYAEAIKLAACMNQLYLEGAVTIPNGTPWYKPYVDFCIEKGIIDKEYNYNDKATRAGYMDIFAKALPDEALKAINNVPDDSIPDVPSSRNYAKGVYKLYRAGILTGVDAAHNCNPLANITRGEVAAILARMMNEGKRVAIVDMAKEEKEEIKEEVKEEIKEEIKEDKEEIKEEEKPEEEVKEEEKEEIEEEVKETDEEKQEDENEPSAEEPEAVELAIAEQSEDREDTYNSINKLYVEAAGGTVPYTYQWQRLYYMKVGNRERRVFRDVEDVAGTISGAKTASLNVVHSEAGEYTYMCIITDAKGATINSKTITITCNEASSGGRGSIPTGKNEYME